MNEIEAESLKLTHTPSEKQSLTAECAEIAEKAKREGLGADLGNDLDKTIQKLMKKSGIDEDNETEKFEDEIRKEGDNIEKKLQSIEKKPKSKKDG